MPSALKRILYVEDEPDIQAVARLALEMVGRFEVEVCASGEEALVRAPEFAPDLIVLDVMMPGLDGPATLQRLREVPATSDVPVVFVTARVQPEELAAYRAIGAIGVVQKPFDPIGLSHELVRIWKGRGGG